MNTSDNQPPQEGSSGGSVLDKYITQHPEPPTTEPQPTITECYTEMPTHVAMLDLVDEAGNHTAFPYHALESAKYNPSGTITLIFHSQEVTVTGRNLKPIYDGIIRQRVNRVESTLYGDVEDGSTPVVIKIRINTQSL